MAGLALKEQYKNEQKSNIKNNPNIFHRVPNCFFHYFFHNYSVNYGSSCYWRKQRAEEKK